MSGTEAEILSLGRLVIEREAQALARVSSQLDETFVRTVEIIEATPGKVVTTGSGTSGIMAERLAHLLSVCGTPAMYLRAMDALHGGMGAVTSADTVIAVSKGGRSAELTQLVAALVEKNVFVTAVTEAPNSPFAVAASNVVTISTAPKDADLGGLIATASTIVFAAWGDALTAVLMERREHSWEAVKRSHPAGIVGESDVPVVRSEA